MTQEIKKGKIKWKPKKWLVEYDRIVALSVLGKSNIEIGEEVGMTKEHISTILNLDQAKLLYEKLKNRIRESIEDNIPAQLEESARIASKNVMSVLKDERLMERAPMQIAKLSMDVLKGVGHLRTVNAQPTQTAFNIINNGQMAVVSPQQKSDLLEGLDKIKQIAEIHAPILLKDGTNG